MTEISDARDRELSITRVFDAPREKVWRAWSEPVHLMQWWGPNGFTNTFHEFDFRPGGEWRLTMHGPDGTDYKNESRFVEIVPGERFVFDHLSWPKFRGSATFEDAPGGKTRVTFRQLFETAEDFAKVRVYAEPANTQWMEKLAAYVASIDADTRELTITRTFDAPREKVWRAWTDPRHLAQWWGPDGFTNPVCEIDLRPGGALRIVMRAPDGAEYPMRGEFREIWPPERLVFTNFPVDDADQPMIDGVTTVTFAERGGKTEMVLHTRAVALVPLAIRMIAGMEPGWRQSIDRLAAYLASGG
jgi:uncharacterized protein YndB with AHSA1/START domain